MYNDNRERLHRKSCRSHLCVSRVFNVIGGLGHMVNNLNSIWICLCVNLFCLGLPSTLSSDARVESAGLGNTSLDSGHSASKQKGDSLETRPQPSYSQESRKHEMYRENLPEKRNVFYNKIPQNKIPREKLPKSAIPRAPMPRTVIPSNSIPKSPIQNQKIEKKQIEKNPLPKKNIPRNPLPRNRIPSD